MRRRAATHPHHRSGLPHQRASHHADHRFANSRVISQCFPTHALCAGGMAPCGPLYTGLTIGAFTYALLTPPSAPLAVCAGAPPCTPALTRPAPPHTLRLPAACLTLPLRGADHRTTGIYPPARGRRALVVPAFAAPYTAGVIESAAPFHHLPHPWTPSTPASNHPPSCPPAHMPLRCGPVHTAALHHACVMPVSAISVSSDVTRPYGHGAARWRLPPVPQACPDHPSVPHHRVSACTFLAVLTSTLGVSLDVCPASPDRFDRSDPSATTRVVLGMAPHR